MSTDPKRSLPETPEIVARGGRKWTPPEAPAPKPLSTPKPAPERQARPGSPPSLERRPSPQEIAAARAAVGPVRPSSYQDAHRSLERRPPPPSQSQPRSERPALRQAPSLDSVLDEALVREGEAIPDYDGELSGSLDAPWAKSDQDLLAEEMDRLMKGGPGRRGGGLKEGDRISGQVVQISGDEAFVDVGSKSEAIVASSELKGPGGEWEVKVGDRIDAYVVATGSGGLRISRRMALEAKSKEAVRDAYAARMPLEGRISARNKGGFEVRFQSGQTAFLPVGQVDLHHVPDDMLDSYIGRSFSFRITKYEGDGRELVVSRAAVLKEEREILAEEMRATLQVGDVREGTVRKVEKFGAFVDLGGVDGLVPVSEMSWSRTEDPQDVVKVGETVRVKVLRIEVGKNRIALSMRQAEGDPWETVGTRFLVDGVYEGRVTRVEPFGAFVELAPGLEGLIHVSRLSWQRVRHPDQVVQPGQGVTVKLIEADPFKRRLSLSMKDVSGDPWEETTATWLPGTTLSGTVEKVAPFGLLVSLSEAVTGLVPNDELGMDGTQARRSFSAGKPVTVEVLSLDRVERRIRLRLSSGDRVSEKEAIRDYTEGRAQGGQAATGFGTFGDLLKGLKTRK